MEEFIMDKLRIDVTVLEPTAININEDSNGAYLMIGEHRAYVPPHYTGKNFNNQEVISFLLTESETLGSELLFIFCVIYFKRKKSKISRLITKL